MNNQTNHSTNLVQHQEDCYYLFIIGVFTFYIFVYLARYIHYRMKQRKRRIRLLEYEKLRWRWHQKQTKNESCRYLNEKDMRTPSLVLTIPSPTYHPCSPNNDESYYSSSSSTTTLACRMNRSKEREKSCNSSALRTPTWHDHTTWSFYDTKAKRRNMIWKWSVAMGYCNYEHAKTITSIIDQLDKPSSH